MPRNFLVSLISEQTLPNYLLIKEFQKQGLNIDKYVFLSTERMEKLNKTQDIIETLGLKKQQYWKTNIFEDRYYDTKAKLDKLNFQREDNILVNLTGGTKLISISAWEYFKQFPNVRFFYVPIGKNVYKEVFKDKPAVEKEFTYTIGWKEYLSIYGIKAESQELQFSEQDALDILKLVKNTGYSIDKFPLNYFQRYGFKNLKQYNELLTRWFEEFLYYRIKQLLKLTDKQIAPGLILYEKRMLKKNLFYQHDNQVDSFFIYNNNPYIIEAKFSLGKKMPNTLAQYLFKLSAINRRFGLRARATIFTLANLDAMGDNAKEHLKVRCHLLNIACPVGRNQIIDEENLKSALKEFVK